MRLLEAQPRCLTVQSYLHIIGITDVAMLMERVLHAMIGRVDRRFFYLPFATPAFFSAVGSMTAKWQHGLEKKPGRTLVQVSVTGDPSLPAQDTLLSPTYFKSCCYICFAAAHLQQ